MQSSSCRLVPEVRETRTAAGTQTAGVFSIPLIPPIAIGGGGGVGGHCCGAAGHCLLLSG